MIKTIGLTGGIASGKTTVAKILRELGVEVINADDYARQALDQGKHAYFQVIGEFGAGVLGEDGRINREALGSRIFKNPEARKRLEEIIWPVVIKEIKEAIDFYTQKGLKLLVVEAPLLFEAGQENLFDAVWVVSIERSEQIKRLMERNGFTEEEAGRRIAAQLPLEYKEEKAEVVIENNAGFDELKEQVVVILKKMERCY